jgi:hypothetical protein
MASTARKKSAEKIRSTMPAARRRQKKHGQTIENLRSLLQAFSMMPGPGDIIGPAQDVQNLIANPEDRTMPNVGLMALGLLPGVPSGLGQKAKMLKHKLTKAENNFFSDVFANPADRRELLENVPSARLDEKHLYASAEDTEKLLTYVDETRRLHEGSSRLPPSFYRGWESKMRAADAVKDSKGIRAALAESRR